MRDLYKMELKKLWKHKHIRLCFLGLFVFVIGFGVSTYQRYSNQSGLKNETLIYEGETYTGFSAIRELDRFHHEHFYTTKLDQATYATWIKQFQDHLQTATDETMEASITQLYVPSMQPKWVEREAYLLTKEKIDKALIQLENDPLALYADDAPKIMLQELTRTFDDQELTYINQRIMTMPTLYDAKQGYEYVMCGMVSLQASLIFGLCLLAVIISGLFTQEYMSHVDQLTHAVVRTTGKQAIAKLLVGLSVTILLCLLMVLCIYGVPAIMIGFYSLDQPIVEFPMTMLEQLIRFLILFVIACLSYGSIFLFLSSIFNNRFTCFIASLVWILLSYVLGYVPGFESIRYLLPGSMIIPPFDYEMISMFDHVYMRTTMIGVVWLILTCFFLYGAYFNYKHREVKNV